MLKFSGDAQSFYTAASMVARACETKTTIPALGGVLLSSQGPGQMAAQATDLAVALAAKFEAVVESEGEALVPAAKLLPVLSGLSGQVTFEVLETRWVKLSWRGGRARLPGLTPEMFPAVPALPELPESVKAADLSKLLERASIAAAQKDEGHFSLSGALLIFAPGTVTGVCADGHRLSVAKCDREGGGDFQEFITLRGVDLARSIKGEVVKVGSTHDRTFFVTDQCTLAVKKFASKFPAWESVVPAENPVQVVVAPGALLPSLRRLSVVADLKSRQARLVFSAEGLKVAASSAESGETEETLATAVQGGEAEVGFNVRYLEEFFEKAEKAVTIAVRDEATAGKMSTEGWTYVVMPISNKRK